MEGCHNLSGEACQQQQRDPGSIWNNKKCLSELSCLLPIAALRCPKLVSSESLIYGLLPTRWGFILLAAILLNNPLLVRKTLFLLSDFLQKYEDSLLSSDDKQMLTQPSPEVYAKHHMLLQQGFQGHMQVHSVKQAMLTMLQLGKISSSLACLCREVLTINCAGASIAVFFTAEYICDEVDFLLKVIFLNAKTSGWMLRFLRGSQKDSLSNFSGLSDQADVVKEIFLETATNLDICSQLQGGSLRIRKALLADAHNTREKFGWSGQLHGHLRIFCLLICAADLPPLPEEVEFWLKSLIDVEGCISKLTLQLGVTFLCLVPWSSMTTLSRSLFPICLTKLLKWNVPKEARYATEVEEQAIWFGVQLLLRQFPAIAQVAREVIGTQPTIQSTLIRELHDAAMTAGVIESTILLGAVAGLRVQGPLSSKMMRDHYMLECLNQLLRSGLFFRHGIDVSDAIAHVISVSTTPIHGLVVELVQAYTEASGGKTGSQTFKMPPLSRSFLEDSFPTIPPSNSNPQINYYGKNKEESTPPAVARAVLTSYYMLCSERVLRGKGAGSCESSITSSFCPIDCEKNWWSALLLRIPFSELFHYMEERWLDFNEILPLWMGLAASLFPERMVISDLLTCLTRPVTLGVVLNNEASDNMAFPRAASEHVKTGSLCQHQGMGRKLPGTMLNVDDARRATDDALLNPDLALQFLSMLHHMSAEVRNSKEALDVQMSFIKELVPKLLDPECSQCLQEFFCLWFKSLQPFLRQILLPAFLESIFDTTLEPDNASKARSLVVQLKAMVSELNMIELGVHNSLVQQPLILLACKAEVYHTPLLSTVLDLLQEFCTINRRTCLEVTSEGKARDQKIKSEEVMSALLAQDSALCQILLEACLPHGDNFKPSSLLKARAAICGFLAPFLETNHDLLKLVHLQGYNPQLVSMMVKGVPAMVHCLNYAPELLEQKEPFKKAFAVNLIADVACFYIDLPESLVAVQKALAHVRLVWKAFLASSSFIQGVLEALVRCACTFSPVAADVKSILQNCRRLSGPPKRGSLPVDPILHNATVSAVKRIRQETS